MLVDSTVCAPPAVAGGSAESVEAGLGGRAVVVADAALRDGGVDRAAAEVVDGDPAGVA